MLLFPIVWVQTAFVIFFSLNLSYNNAPFRSISSTLLGISSNIELSVNKWASTLGVPIADTALHVVDLLESPVTVQIDGVPYSQNEVDMDKDNTFFISDTPFYSSTTEDKEDDKEKPRILQMNIAANISACLSTLAFCIFTWFRKRIQKEQYMGSEYPIMIFFECHKVSAVLDLSYPFCPEDLALSPYQATIDLTRIGSISLANEILQEAESYSASEEPLFKILLDESELAGLEEDVQEHDIRGKNSADFRELPDSGSDLDIDDALLDDDKDRNSNRFKGLDSANPITEDSNESDGHGIDPALLPLPPDSPSDWLPSNQENLSESDGSVDQQQTQITDISCGSTQIGCIISPNESTRTESRELNPENTIHDRPPFASDSVERLATRDNTNLIEHNSEILMHADSYDDLLMRSQEDFQSLPNAAVLRNFEQPKEEEKVARSKLDQIENARCDVHDEMQIVSPPIAKPDCEEVILSSDDKCENVNIGHKKSRLPVSNPVKLLSKPAALSKDNNNISRSRISSVSVADGTMKIPMRVVSQNSTVEYRRAAKELTITKHSLSPTSSMIPQSNTSPKPTTKEKKFPIFSNPSLLKTFVIPPSSPLPTNSLSSPPPSPQLTWDSRWGDGREIIYQSYTAELNQADMLPDVSHNYDLSTQPQLRTSISERHGITGKQSKQSVQSPKRREAEKSKQRNSTSNHNVRFEDRLIKSGEKDTSFGVYEVRLKSNNITRNSDSSKPPKSIPCSSTFVGARMSTDLLECPTKQRASQDHLDCHSQTRTTGIIKDVIRDIDEVSLPVLLERMQSRTRTVTTAETPTRLDLKVTDEIGIHRDESDNFSPSLISSVPRDVASNAHEQAFASASINFADLAENEAILAQGGLIPLSLQSSFSIPTFNITCNSYESRDVSQQMTSGETVREHSSSSMGEKAIKSNGPTMAMVVPKQGRIGSNSSFVFGGQEEYIVPSDTRSASLSRALAEPFTLLDGLPSPDISRNIDSSSSSVHLSGDAFHPTSIAPCTTNPSASVISHDIQKEKQVDEPTKRIDTHENSFENRLRSQEQPENMVKRRHTYWEIIKEAESEKSRNQHASVVESNACSSTSSGLQNSIGDGRATNKGTPSLVSDVLTYEASNGSSSSTSSPWAQSYLRSFAPPEIETSASYSGIPTRPIEGLNVDRNMTRSLSPPTRIEGSNVGCQRIYHPLLPSSPIWRHDGQSESIWTGPETVYNWPPGGSVQKIKNKGGPDFREDYLPTNSATLAHQITPVSVRRPTTPPSPKPRSSWYMPGSKEDQKFWAEYEARQKRKAAARFTSISL